MPLGATRVGKRTGGFWRVSTRPEIDPKYRVSGIGYRVVLNICVKYNRQNEPNIAKVGTRPTPAGTGIVIRYQVGSTGIEQWPPVGYSRVLFPDPKLAQNIGFWVRTGCILGTQPWRQHLSTSIGIRTRSRAPS